MLANNNIMIKRISNALTNKSAKAAIEQWSVSQFILYIYMFISFQLYSSAPPGNYSSHASYYFFLYGQPAR
jgi:hypothetical protein